MASYWSKAIFQNKPRNYKIIATCLIAASTLVLGAAIAEAAYYAGIHLPDFYDEAVHMTPVRSGKAVKLYACSSRWTDARIKCRFSGKNFIAYPGNVVECNISKGNDDPVAVVTPRDSTKPLDYHYKFDFRLGSKGAQPDKSFHYQLPFYPGNSSRITGTYGTNTHIHNKVIEYAIDFKMSPGATICATRAGTVVGVRDSSDTGGNHKFFAKAANYIFIKHDDGTYSQYYHLKKNGVSVKPGDVVKAGDYIGEVGVTGWSSGPHLHYEVFFIDDKGKKQTMPIIFDTDKGAYAEPKMGDIVRWPTDRTHTSLPVPHNSKVTE